jgi:hypothetical protein
MSEVVDRLGVHFLNLDNMQASVQNKWFFQIKTTAKILKWGTKP